MKLNKENYNNQRKITQNEKNVNKQTKKNHLNTVPKLANHTIEDDAEYYL